MRRRCDTCLATSPQGYAQILGKSNGALTYYTQYHAATVDIARKSDHYFLRDFFGFGMADFGKANI